MKNPLQHQNFEIEKWFCLAQYFFSKQGAPWKITLKKTDGLPDALCTTSTTHTMHHKSIIPCGKMKIAADDDELEKSYLVLYIYLKIFPL